MKNCNSLKKKHNFKFSSFFDVRANIKKSAMLCFFISSLAVGQVNAQSKPAEKMTNVKVEDVFERIEKQSKYVFLFKNNEVNTNKVVSVDNINGDIESVLQQVLNGMNVGYQIVDNQIMLSKVNIAAANDVKVKGLVKDVNGEPLIGVNVVVANSTAGTITDFNGEFTIDVPMQSTLEFRYIGYVNKKSKITSSKNLNIILEEDSKTLDEVVVTALGIKREQKALSYNVQQVKSDAITAVKDANFMNSLNGKVAGVQINSGASGPGGATRVVMRGMKSITKDNNALYVIDGVPMFNMGKSGGEGEYGAMGGSDAVADLNPDDIESINMMTGPSAAALYGSAASNGVVMINTKKGSAEKTTVTVSNNTTFSRAYTMPKMQNKYGTSTNMYSWGDETNRNYRPKDFFNTGTNIINSVALSTGTKKNQTYISASTTNTRGIILNNDYNRYNFTARNVTTFANDKLILDLGGSYILQDHQNMVAQGQYYNPIPAVYLFPRGDDFNEVRLYERFDTLSGHMKQYWPYGDGSLSLQNPYWTQKKNLRETTKKRYMLNASLKWNITDWLNVIGRVNVDNSDYRMKEKKYASTLATLAGLNGGYKDMMRQERAFYMDALLNIDKTFGDFRLNVNIGSSLQYRSLNELGFAGDLKIANFFAINNINYVANYKPEVEGWEDEIQSIFASAEVGWRNQLYLTVTGRNDWDSKLAFSSNSSFFYPSVGVSGILTEMFTLPEFINYAKVRGSYTMVASSFERFLTNPGYEYSSQTHNWSNPTVYPATDLKPEKTKSWEIGLNTRFWKNRISIDATYYKSSTLNQTFKVDIPSTSGYSKAVVQTGKVENQGIELGIGFNEKWGDFSWNSSLTYTLNKNKVKRLAGGATNPVTKEPIQMDELKVGWLGKANVAPQVILTEGGTMTDIYVYNHIKNDNNGNIFVDSQTGNISMVTTNKPEKVGQLSPKYNLGWSNNFNYKGINLGMVLTARVGGLAYSATQGVLDYYGASAATAEARDNGGIWVNNGMVDAQKYYQTIGSGEGGYGKYYLYKATNVRLQELSLTYDLPKKWFKDVANVSVGVVGRNLWLIYCKAPFDPELSASTSSNYYMNVDYFMQPSTRNIGFNLKVQF